jgi:hypothetical protein
MSGLEPDMSGFGGYIRYSSRICLAYPKISFLTLILELRGTKMDETWTQGSPQHKKQVFNEVFFKSKDFLSDFV